MYRKSNRQSTEKLKEIVKKAISEIESGNYVSIEEAFQKASTALHTLHKKTSTHELR